MWVYIKEKIGNDIVFVVGFYDPNGIFKPLTRVFPSESYAMQKVNYLNGGNGKDFFKKEG
jgi:hypothetical protein